MPHYPPSKQWTWFGIRVVFFVLAVLQIQSFSQEDSNVDWLAVLIIGLVIGICVFVWIMEKPKLDNDVLSVEQILFSSLWGMPQQTSLYTLLTGIITAGGCLISLAINYFNTGTLVPLSGLFLFIGINFISAALIASKLKKRNVEAE